MHDFQIWWVFVFVLGMTGVQSITKIVTAVIERKKTVQPAALHEIAQNIERINQAIEATALEVERIGESQRFLTKVLSDKETKTIAGT
ncbi:MAG TPA: hypothetical protein VM099_13565 [Gemmatimonadaceae bacterium]|nr:hypothetical protein [Gemmatimonadaceae bacterium]